MKMNSYMRNMIRGWGRAIAYLLITGTVAVAQKIDDERMRRDIEVAENVLTTLIKQQFNHQKTFFPLEINGSYQSGYGVTFTLPADFTTPIVFSISQDNANGVVVWGSEFNETNSFNYSFGDDNDSGPLKTSSNTYTLKDRNREKRSLNMDSIREAYNVKVIDAAKTFVLDYGDMITQLNPNERIVISNQGNQPRVWVNQYFNAPRRTHLAIEAQKSDLTAFKQGKLTRDQALSKIKVINTETVDTVEADLELLSSIFTRLYSQDLSKTYFIGQNIYYERLKDFGVIYYMHVYSAIARDYGKFVMPTLGLDNVDMETRNKKIIEIYPKFEHELKENILEYGRTLKSLKDDEVLVMQVKMTQCPECGIPSSLECSVKGSVLKEFGSGALDKKAAMNKITVRKGSNQ